MTLVEILAALRRRWYVVAPGFVIAIAAAVTAWVLIPPDYERSAAQLLLPAQETLPESSSNPYLFLNGLTSVADVIVRAVGSEDVARQITEPYPGAEIEVSRDPQSAGPVVLITVRASSDRAAEELIDAAVAQSSETIVSLQREQGIPEQDRIRVTTITHDGESTLLQRGRLTVAAVASLGVAISTLLLAALLDGLERARRRREPSSTDAIASAQRLGRMSGNRR
ncbi:hypothetical protein [Agrococcus sp. TF02-05]|uniref:hypothetical protein n=1 Tax=Agrococcus sp. TF02-05 TaxID=2815211 RepID=UPI001AA1A7B0|nr:hypothetical protein [Agrococcus sp. TF02-05]MBO1769111.1 hypothetical protein [Agrococcus sp. TF02-05]